MKEKEMSLNLCVTCGFDYTYSLKILLLQLKLCTCACLGKKRYGSVGMKTQKGAMSKLNRAIPSSAVGAGSARIHKANCFRAGEPRPYELNDSIIRGLTQLLFFILYQGIYTDYSPLIAATPGRTFPSIASSKAPPPVEM